jgi:hypothetical protein
MVAGNPAQLARAEAQRRFNMFQFDVVMAGQPFEQSCDCRDER